MILWIRADASPSTGFGHVMRSLALAEAADERGIAIRIVSAAAPGLDAELGRRGLERVPPDGWPDAVSAGDLVVFDGYAFGPRDERRARDAGATVAAVADHGRGAHDVEILVDPNPREAHAYDLPAEARVLFGPRYALVRREFRREADPASRRLLLTFGGSDVAGLGGLVSAAIDGCVRDGSLPFDEVVLLCGPGAATPPAADWLQVERSPDAVGDLFAGCAAAISAAGSTIWELLTVGVATALVQVADNQAAVAGGTVAAGAAIDLGEAPPDPEAVRRAVRRLGDPDERGRLRAAGRTLVDGRGADRVLDELLAAGQRGGGRSRQ